MKNLHYDTIAARATPPGRGGVGIIRVSGSHVSEVALAVIGKLPEPRYATFCQFKDENNSVIDQGLALYFKAPNSFTGEDVLELHGHGGPIIQEVLLDRILNLDVRLARPGEFSERAYLNNKIDLAQAEAIADLIEASSLQAARSAMESLQGKFSEEINSLVEEVIHLRTYVEAAIDFPEEEIDFLADGVILNQLIQLVEKIQNILSRAKQGKILKEGMRVVIAGLPNAGKSSLLNALSGEETAIVSHIPGTTRDIIRETICLDGMPLKIIDTAGLRESTDKIELEGVRRAWNEFPNADCILFIIDSSALTSVNEEELLHKFDSYHDRLTLVYNKIDLVSQQGIKPLLTGSKIKALSVSAKTGVGLDLLRTHLKEVAGFQCGENAVAARQRHLEALNKANEKFNHAVEQLTRYKAGELVAQELWEAQNALSTITGEYRSDDLLGEIFSSFCIGK
jgi:tRNA modification GTPase